MTRFFRAPDASDIALSDVVSDLQLLVRRHGGITKFGFVYRGESLAGQPLRPEDHDPRITDKIADLAGFGEGSVVGDVFEVLRVRPGPPDRAGPAALANRDLSVIGGRDVTLTGELLPEDDGMDERRPQFSPRAAAATR
jgi:hypothetical protein